MRITGLNQNVQVKNDFSRKANRANFNQLFQASLGNGEEVKFSKHAMQRLEQRNISLEPNDLKKIGESMDRAHMKGAREALVVYDDLLMIASVQNRTIITAMTKDQTESDIITNVDSAIFVK